MRFFDKLVELYDVAEEHPFVAFVVVVVVTVVIVSAIKGC